MVLDRFRIGSARFREGVPRGVYKIGLGFKGVGFRGFQGRIWSFNVALGREMPGALYQACTPHKTNL